MHMHVYPGDVLTLTLASFLAIDDETESYHLSSGIDRLRGLSPGTRVKSSVLDRRRRIPDLVSQVAGEVGTVVA